MVLKYKKYIYDFVIVITISKNKFIVLSFMMSIFLFCAAINITSYEAVLYTIRFIMLIMVVFKIFCVYGEGYFREFLISFCKIMMIFNFISIFEYKDSINYFYTYIIANKSLWFLNAGKPIFRISSVFLHPIVYGNILVINLVILLLLKNRLKNILLCWINFSSD